MHNNHLEAHERSYVRHHAAGIQVGYARIRKFEFVYSLAGAWAAVFDEAYVEAYGEVHHYVAYDAAGTSRWDG